MLLSPQGLAFNIVVESSGLSFAGLSFAGLSFAGLSFAGHWRPVLRSGKGQTNVDFQQFRVAHSKRVQLADHDPAFTGEWSDESAARHELQTVTNDLAKYQDMLFAHEAHAVLMLFQSMDASGKDEAIQDVLSGVDPQGCKATKFGAPSSQELKHDYMRRFVKALPESGQIGIFNRSYYEQLTGDRIHRERLKDWQMQPQARGEDLWRQRFEEVNNFEQYLSGNGVVVLKFFLNVSKHVQGQRLLERTQLPEKKWQFSDSDMEDRKRWSQFMRVYEDTLTHTSTKAAPWYIVPADHRWFVHLTVASITASTLRSLHSKYPTLDAQQRESMAAAQRQLEKEVRRQR
jgi:PPK2 family polyphosphate:nucleotide phosphotransferase